MNFYQRLRDIREDNDLKQIDIAKVLGIEQTNYSKYELGKNMMGIDKYITLAKFYNISLDYLCGIIDEPKKLNNQKNPPHTSEEEKKEQKMLILFRKYEQNPDLQKAIDKLLDIK